MASGSRGCGQGSAVAGAGALDTLTNPDLALLPAVDLVVHLHRDDRSGSDFADVALVLAVRERRLAEAEARIREADVDAAGLRERIRALERRIGAAELMGGEIRPRDLAASETVVVPELLAGEITPVEIINATPAEVGDNMPRRTPRRKIGATLPAASSMPDELAEERALERVVLDSREVVQAGAVDSREEISEAVASRRKKEPTAALVSHEKEEEPLQKKPKLAGDLGVASKDSDTNSDSQVEETEEELHFTEAQGWKMLDILKAQVAAWESEYDAADAAQGTLQTTETPPPLEEVQTVIEVEAHERNEAIVARLQEEIILHERRLEEVKDRAKKTEERLCAEITKCKDKASKTEAVLWDEILLARSSAVTELEVWKHSVVEAQGQIREASMTVARLCNEIEARKHIASETEMCLETQDKIIAMLQAKVEEGKCKLAKAESRIRVSDELATQLQDNIEASEKNRAIEVEAHIHRATKIEEDLQAKISMLELKIANLEAHGSGISRSDHTVAIHEHNHSCTVPKIELHGVVPAGATMKAQRQKGVSFYDKIYKSEMEKRKLIGNQENEEILKKQAAKAASKALSLRCWSQAPHLPALLGSQTAEEDSDEA
ncbi:nuclear autoantigenic sperm protein [Sorghum bicolor]|uniref:nuclear autoantigenic sperm protein n=1 Tax=Sorghum bicolor TaxID=4558 RepID=UPI0001A8655D|nr:nuclear autoantigenic sperm protein [Sorghum bicolor]|eukprot:XP_002449679.1 nuclear autoantigenic sperm protein [Sorghum bicolor]